MSKLKIKPDHLEYVRNECLKVLDRNPNAIENYENGRFVRSDAVKDLQKRFSFDVLDAAGLTKFICETLYPYMNDDHLYSALKSFMPKVEKKY